MIRSAVLTLLFLTGSVVLAVPDAAAQSTDNALSRPDSVGDVGYYATVVLNSLGNPVVAYQNLLLGELKLLVCGDPACTNGNTITIPDTVSLGGGQPSMVLDGNDFPVMSYRDGVADNLKVVRCGDTTCTAANVYATPDPVIGGGYGTSIALDASDNPVIAHYDVGAQDLRIVACGDPTCSTGNVISTPDVSGDSVGQAANLRLNAAGNPVVAYYDSTNEDVKLLTCGNVTCSAGNIIETPVSLGDVGLHISMALDGAGNPVVAYRDRGAPDIHILHCTDPTCSGALSITNPDPGATDGGWYSLVIDAAGHPAVSYFNIANFGLRILRCGDPNCSAGNTVSSPDTAGTTGHYTSIALDASGNPVVAYLDALNADLRVLHCGDAVCTPTICNGLVASMNLDTNPTDYNGTESDDVIWGTTGADIINGKGGNDTICARSGDDTIRGGAGDDTIGGGPGDDDIMGGGGADFIQGGSDNDTIDGQGGTDTIDGENGDDTIDGRGAADDLTGGADDDTIAGQNGGDILNGGPGVDDLSGQTGPDTFFGGPNADDMRGGEGADTLYGGPGVDKCAGNTGPDSAQAMTCESTPGVEVLF